MIFSGFFKWLFRIKPKEIIKKDKNPEVIVVSTNKELEDKYDELKCQKKLI